MRNSSSIAIKLNKWNGEKVRAALKRNGENNLCNFGTSDGQKKKQNTKTKLAQTDIFFRRRFVTKNTNKK